MSDETSNDLKFLDKKAAALEEMPNGLNPIEQAYYLSARYIYRDFKDEKISIEQAREEKKQVIKQYMEGMKAWGLFVGIHNLKSKMKELKEQGFNSVLEWEILEDIDKFIKGGS